MRYHGSICSQGSHRVSSSAKSLTFRTTENVRNGEVGLQLRKLASQPLLIDLHVVELLFDQQFVLFEGVKDVPDILVGDLAYHFDLVALVLAHIRVGQSGRQIRILVNQRERLVDLLRQTLHRFVDLVLELILLDVGDLVFLLEQDQIGSNLLDFDLELLHELLVGLVFLI